MIDLLLLFFLVVCAIAAISSRDLLSSTIILGAYSLVMAVVWMRLNAVDVAFTEASVGAGMSAMLMIAALSRTKRGEGDYDENQAVRRSNEFDIRKASLFLVVLVTAGILVYGTMDMPDFGDKDAPAHTHVAKRYIEKGYEETAELNMVSAVLASYRGYDTMGETTVIFTAGIAVILLLRRKKRE